MDGRGLIPDRPEELGPEKNDDDVGGAIIVGTKGKTMWSTYGNDTTLLPPLSRSKEVDMTPVMKRISERHYVQWVNAFIAGFGKNELSFRFDYAGPLTETILMGNLALRSWNIKDSKGDFSGRKKILRDAKNMKVTNFDEADQFLGRSYKPDYSFEL